MGKIASKLASLHFNFTCVSYHLGSTWVQELVAWSIVLHENKFNTLDEFRTSDTTCENFLGRLYEALKKISPRQSPVRKAVLVATECSRRFNTLKKELDWLQHDSFESMADELPNRLQSCSHCSPISGYTQTP